MTIGRNLIKTHLCADIKQQNSTMKKMPTVLVMSFVIFVKLVQGQMVNPDIKLSHNNEELLNSNTFNVSKKLL